MDEKEIRKRLAGRAAEYMMFKDDKEENAEMTAEISSSVNVIVFPNFEKLKNEVEKEHRVCDLRESLPLREKSRISVPNGESFSSSEEKIQRHKSEEHMRKRHTERYKIGVLRI